MKKLKQYKKKNQILRKMIMKTHSKSGRKEKKILFRQLSKISKSHLSLSLVMKKKKVNQTY